VKANAAGQPFDIRPVFDTIEQGGSRDTARAMSQENVENLRAFLETWGREPWTPEALQRGLPFDMSLLDSHVTYEDATLPDHIGEAYSGHEGIVRAARRWIEPFEWLLIELEQIIDADDCLVSIHRLRSKAQHTGMEFDMPLAYVWAFRGGKVIHFESFREPGDARDAAGLTK
jgi:ketosteroid isomerase-like protein